jgi:hypothetical protein
MYTFVFPVNNFFVFPAFFLFLLAGDANIRKEILWKEFEWAHMRQLPTGVTTYHRLKEFDIVFLQPGSQEPETPYSHTFVVGKYTSSKGCFERTHLLSRVNPFTEYELVKAVSDYYQTDSTYLDVLLRNRKNKLESVVYRKARTDTTQAEGRSTVLKEEFVMWKKERILLTNGNLTTRLIEKWNKERFE